VAIDMVRKRRPLALAMERAQQEDDAELRILLVDALRTLPRRQREVVALRFLHGFSEVDVAQVLRVSPGTVKKTTHRAMEALRQKLGSAFDPATMTTTEETSDAF
jgi:RNA polymerase sigma factor (sigma-70 family)